MEEDKKKKSGWLFETKIGASVMMIGIGGILFLLTFGMIGGFGAIIGSPDWHFAFKFCMALLGFPLLITVGLFLLGIFKGEDKTDIGPSFTYGCVIYFVTLLGKSYVHFHWSVLALVVTLVCYIIYLKRKGMGKDGYNT